ncbi:MAG: PEP-utilizing enzyme [Patescibacteria group bacterium]|jgi:phosphoenolpyruvate synthase/pyruvate phosphate dikinase
MDKNISPNFNKKDWLNFGRWVQPTISGCFWCHWHETKSVKELSNLRFNEIIFLDGQMFSQKQDQEKIKKFISKICRANQIPAFINKFEKIAQQYEKNHLAVLKNKSLPLKDYLFNLFSSYQEIVGIWQLAIFLDSHLAKYILDNKIISDEQELFNKIQPGLRTTWLEKQNQEIKTLAIDFKKIKHNLKLNPIKIGDFKKYPQLAKKIKQHVNNFSWYGTHHWMGEPYSLKKCLQQINEELKKKVISSQSKNNRIKIEDSLRLLVVLAYWRTHCAELTCRVVFESRQKMIVGAKKWGLTYEQFVYLSSQEIIFYLNNELKFKLPANFLQRKLTYGCYLDNQGKENIITGQKFNFLFKRLIDTPPTTVKEIRGMVANSGKEIIGRATLIISPKDFSNFKKGDILVAPETTPDFVPYMKLAAAIITERGGITSHAAIISRELGVPCIVGAKMATQIIKTGEQIQIFPVQGLIKIIKNKI